MAEFPFLPLSVDAYFRKTRHLSTAQHGAYLLLLMEAWQRPNSGLPDDDQMLARLVCMSVEEWQATKPVVMAFWKMDERSKCWTQKRLLEAKSYVKKNSDKQRSNAKSRWDKDKTASHGTAKSDAKTMPEVCQTDASQSQSQSTDSSPSPSRQSAPPAAADEFERVLKTLHAAPGVSAHPVFAVGTLNPLWGMIQQGWSLETEILPVVSALASKAKPGTIRSWKYFVDEIVAQRQGIPAPPPPAEVSMEDWESRLRFGRRNTAWPADWGPHPNQPGCKVPATLIKPDDGKGWTEWKAAS